MPPRRSAGYAVAAQVKGTAVGFPGENQAGFRFTCEADHIDYWLRCGRPVVLICVNVRDQRAWWKRLDTWFADPARRARRVVDFDKAADAFDVSAFSLLSAIAVPVGEAMPRLEGSEQLVSNLLTVTGFAPRIRSASTPCRDRADAWERMRSNSAFERRVPPVRRPDPYPGLAGGRPAGGAVRRPGHLGPDRGLGVLGG